MEICPVFICCSPTTTSDLWPYIKVMLHAGQGVVSRCSIHCMEIQSFYLLLAKHNLQLFFPLHNGFISCDLWPCTNVMSHTGQDVVSRGSIHYCMGIQSIYLLHAKHNLSFFSFIMPSINLSFDLTQRSNHMLMSHKGHITWSSKGHYQPSHWNLAC